MLVQFISFDSPVLHLKCFYQPSACFVLVLRLLYVFCVGLFVGLLVGLCIPTYRVRTNYITYIAAMRFYFLVNFGQPLWVLV